MANEAGLRREARREDVRSEPAGAAAGAPEEQPARAASPPPSPEAPPPAAAPRRPRLGPRGPVGTMVRTTPHGVQVVRTRGHRWSDEAEELFLDSLALTCNAALAAEQVGFSGHAVYRRRRLDPLFAAKWNAAMQQGVARLQLLLVRGAEASLEGRAPDPESPLPPMSVADAIAIVRMFGEGGPEARRSRAWHARPRDLDEVRASILRKLDAIERADSAPAANDTAPDGADGEGGAAAA